jgi:UDP-N-acetylglucosamine acyltransferase
VNLAGHVEVEDYAIVGGLTPVHQFVRLGRYSITGGASRAAKDMPPFMKSAGNPIRVVGPNSIGLARNGFAAPARRAVKEAYRLLYRCDLNVSQAVERIREQLPDSVEAAQIVDFIERSDRGIVR